MARILNVIHLPHLVSYKPFDDSEHRCCTVCEYKVMIETDEGTILAASAIDESELKEFDIDEAIMKLSDKTQNEDCFYAVDRFVDEDRFDSFVNGEIEEGHEPTSAFYVVLDSLIRSRHPIRDDLRERLRNVADNIEKLLNIKE